MREDQRLKPKLERIPSTIGLPTNRVGLYSWKLDVETGRRARRRSTVQVDRIVNRTWTIR